MHKDAQSACSKRVPKITIFMVSTKFYLDTRKGEAPFPLKIRLNYQKQAVFLLTSFKVDPEQWNGAQVVKHPRAALINTQINARKAEIDCKLYEWKAQGKLLGKTAKQIKDMLEVGEENEQQPTTFGRYFKKYAETKQGLTKHTYDYTYKVLSDYANIDALCFEEITAKWLEGFDRWCTTSNNTKGVHYRNIRAVFNDAIDEEITSAYPFRKFKIKKVEPRQRSLSIEELRKFWFWQVEPQQEKYHDIFKLIFLLRGINLKDLCHLTKENIKAGRIIYNRAKTKKPYSIKIEPEIQELLDKYKGEKYLINILDRYKNYVNFNWRLNKELQKIGTIEIGKRGKKTFIPVVAGITPYWARHSFATIGHYDCGVPMDIISDLLGHSNGMAVTNIYIRKNEKIADEAARKIIDKVLYNK